MRIVRLVLSAALGTSALVGIQILATDYWLWSAAPTHAYGLMAFVALDLALILGVWRVTRLAMIGPLLTAAFQLWLVALLSRRSEEHTSELQSRGHLVCRLLLEKKKKNKQQRKEQ